MVHILGISGSLRQESFNTALLRNAEKLLPEGTTLELITLHGIPLYDGDLEASEGIPAAVAALKEKLRKADGVIIATPEYNNSIPGVLKNAIDWASRPSSDIATVFGGKPFALIGASPGAFGTLLSQTAWLPVLKTLGTNLWTGGSLLVPKAHEVFDAQGKLADAAIEKRLQKFLANFSQSLQ
jgi:chromate reductase